MTGLLTRVILLLALVVACVSGYESLARHHRAQGYETARAEYTAKALQAEKLHRQAEKDLQTKLTEATTNANIRNNKLQAQLRSYRADSERLRNDLATSRRELSSASERSVRERAAALTDVFGECSREVEELARKADGHASDALMFQESWPTMKGNAP